MGKKTRWPRIQYAVSVRVIPGNIIVSNKFYFLSCTVITAGYYTVYSPLLAYRERIENYFL